MPDQEARRGDAYGLSLFDFQLSTLNCLTRIRRNKARMSMKTKKEVKKSSGQGRSPALTHPSPGSLLSPPSPHGRGLLTAFVFYNPPSRTGRNARKCKNRGNKARMSMKKKDKYKMSLSRAMPDQTPAARFQAGSDAAGTARVRRNRVPQGCHARIPGLAHEGRAGRGSSLWGATVAQESGVHGDGGADAGFGHWREYRHL